jgi:hypothetical protein
MRAEWLALLWSRCFRRTTLLKGRSTPCNFVVGFYCRLVPGGNEEEPTVDRTVAGWEGETINLMEGRREAGIYRVVYRGVQNGVKSWADDRHI